MALVQTGTLSHDQMLTDPDEAADFVKATQVDALAIAIGTSHGAYKFTRPPTGDILAIDRIKAIHKRIPDTHLVMHGSSSVPQDWLRSSMSLVAKSQRLMVFLSRRFRKVLSMVFVK